MPQVAKTKVIGPHSKAIQRGAVGDLVDGRTREGKLLRRVEKELTAALQRPPTFSDQLLIRRIARATLQLELFDKKVLGGQRLSEYDGRSFSALSNIIRLGLRELGVKPPSDPNAPPSLAAIIAEKRATQ